ncbi:hypothetical protein GPEL0_01f4134 [Geoanaerobacter pelophilus]|uniref:Uncharacterized protein n=1 Tax=Geoanaerobacter pelophilus TaxID=60036 RepID=A0ABQ0MMI8_9BACT|nr:hypothetical protein GPEL0_01f4134 [Geoanaerobacter pelophilus]
MHGKARLRATLELPGRSLRTREPVVAFKSRCLETRKVAAVLQIRGLRASKVDIAFQSLGFGTGIAVSGTDHGVSPKN